MRSKYTLYILFSLLLLFFCSKSDETYTIEIKDGVKYVHNHAPLWSDETKVALEFVQKIGELEGEDENYLLYNPYDITRNTDGNLYILDQGNYRIQKFDKHGKYLATIGRQGQGPSEFVFPIRIDIDSEGNLYIGDLGNYSVLVLTNDGKEIKRFKLTGGVEKFRLMHNCNFLLATSISKQSEPGVISLYNKEGNLIKEFGVFKDYGNKDLTNRGNAAVTCVDANDNIYVTFYNQNRIEKYSHEGILIFRTDWPLNYKIGIDNKKIKILSSGKAFYRFTPVSEYIGVDHKNRIWVQTYIKQKDEGDEPLDYFEFKIFDNNGVLLGNLSPPQNFNIMRIFQDRLYLIDRKEEMCVYEYKIVEK